jgi:hypothetical protein
MKTTLSSRERLLTAMALQEPDHVPLWNLWNHSRDPFNPRDPLARVDAVLALGMDDTLLLDPPWRMSPEVTTRVWQETPPGSPYPHVYKEYDTPAGTLRQGVRLSVHWPQATDLPIFGDLNVSHSVKRLVEGPQDLPKLRYLLTGPDAEQVRAFREKARAWRQFANERQILLEGGWLYAGDAAVWLCGVEELGLACYDDPAFVEELLEIVWACEVQRLSLLLDVGVDTVAHRGWYDTPLFWGTTMYRRFLKPLLQREIQLVHEAGVKFRYILTRGVMPLLDDFLELGLDVLWGVDPVQDDVDLRVVQEKLGGRVCIWGGMNSILTLGHGTREEIRTAVTQALETLGPGGGFVLFPVDQILPDTPWENLEILRERWREIASYPLGGGG